MLCLTYKRSESFYTKDSNAMSASDFFHFIFKVPPSGAARAFPSNKCT
jgi:hypothetical protein